MAFYSDRHSIFHIPSKSRAGSGPGLSQLGRALGELNIDIICANTPQAKGRIERAHLTLQDRLVKELRLRGLSGMVEALPFLLEFMEDYNRRFSRPARSPYDAHRPLQATEQLDEIFTLQEERRITNNLTIHYKRDLYVIEDSKENRRLRGARALIHERQDGAVTIKCTGRELPYRMHHIEEARITQGAVVEHKRLDAVFEWIAQEQRQRDAKQLASRKLTLRAKRRIRAAAQQV